MTEVAGLAPGSVRRRRVDLGLQVITPTETRYQVTRCLGWGMVRLIEGEPDALNLRVLGAPMFRTRDLYGAAASQSSEEDYVIVHERAVTLHLIVSPASMRSAERVTQGEVDDAMANFDAAANAVEEDAV